MFDTREIFVTAKALLDLPMVQQAPPNQPVTYWHVAFENHEILTSAGTAVESLLYAPMVEKILSPPQLANLRHALGLPSVQDYQQPLARPCPPMRRQRKFLERLLRNNHPVLDPTLANARSEHSSTA